MFLWILCSLGAASRQMNAISTTWRQLSGRIQRILQVFLIRIVVCGITILKLCASIANPARVECWIIWRGTGRKWRLLILLYSCFSSLFTPLDAALSGTVRRRITIPDGNEVIEIWFLFLISFIDALFWFYVLVFDM